MIDKTLSGKLPIDGDPIWEQTSDECKDLVRKLLNPDPKKRLTVNETENHPWFCDGDGDPEGGVAEDKLDPFASSRSLDSVSFDAAASNNNSLLTVNEGVHGSDTLAQTQSASEPFDEDEDEENAVADVKSSGME